MLEGEEHFIDIPGLRIATLRWGPKDGIPIFALHGWVDNAASFSFLAPLLTKYRVIAIDSPGCGHSSHKGAGHFPSIADEAFYILQVADVLGIDKFVLMGHSRGAAVAQLIACGSPERILGLILIDNIGFPLRSNLEHWRHAMNAVLTNQPRPATSFKNLDEAVLARQKAGKINYESAEALTLRGTTQTQDGLKWTFDRREMFFVSPVAFHAQQIEEILANIVAPSCIILAESGIIEKSEGQRRAQFIQNHDLHYVPGHHHVHMDDPETVADIIQSFLNAHVR